MSNINKAAVLNPLPAIVDNIVDYIPRATTSKFGVVALGSGINVDSFGRIYLDTQEYSDRLAAIEAQAASSLATQQTEVAAAIAQVNLTQSQTITALTLEVNTLKTNLTNEIAATETNLINRADQLAQDVTDITNQLTQDKAAFNQEIQDAIVSLQDEASVASALRTPRKIQGVDFDGTQDISLPIFSTQIDGLVPKRVGATSTKYLCEDGTWVIPTNTTYALLTKAVAETGSSTTANTISAKILKDTILYHTPIVTNIAGNAATATKFQTPRTINGVLFDGTQDISVPTVDTVSISKGGTGATTAEQARANLGIAAIPLPAGTNLNDITTAGTYYCSLDAYAATMLNRPTDYSFSLKVDITAGVIQEITTYASGGSRRFIRGFYNVWSQWEEVVKGNKRLNSVSAYQTGIVVPSTEAGIYIQEDGNPFLYRGNAPIAPRWSVDDGGTGGRTAAEARTNLGLGAAATKSVGESDGNVMGVGAFGLGGNNSGALGSFETYRRNRFVAAQPGTAGYPGTHALGYQLNGADQWQVYLIQEVANNDVYFGRRPSPFEQIHWSIAKTTANTWVDGNGFIKAASPIIQLFSDHIELNDEAKLQEITFEKLGVGNYLIKGSTGLAQDGWYIEQPKDSNGNIYHAVEYGTHPNGDIWLKTYEQMMDGTRIVADRTNPIDINENRFISVRLNELPKDTSAPINPTVKDSEGNAAPSRLHELVEGVWEISDENAAILEQERLAAMKPLKRRQFRLTLAMNGYDLNEIEALIDQIEDPMQRTIAQIEWQDATDFERTNPTLLMMAQMLELTSEQVDSLWEYGLAL